MDIRHDWTLEQLKDLYDLPLLSLISRSNAIHTRYHDPAEVHVCQLISIKTGGCPEDCKYCAQSSRYTTSVSAQPMMSVESVIEQAKKAIENGATRVCLGAAWRGVRDNKYFDDVLKMVQGINELGAEVCCTLGMLSENQAEKLKEAGLYAYNHNLDSSEEFYKTIITTRTYQDRLETLDIVEKAKLKVCCGGIIGMGESPVDRLQLLLNLCTRNPHPESVPLNRLTQIPGTPLENAEDITSWELIRLVSITRIVMPKAMIRLSSGRNEMSIQEQAMCFLAGANSIFAGEKLLTVANTPVEKDAEMFRILGIKSRPAFKECHV